MNTDLLHDCLGPTLPPGTPETRAIAVATANGQAALDGNSQQLGSVFDALLLQHLRQWTDVVLVGARTVRAENYGGVKVPERVKALRASRSQAEVPPIAVISRSLEFDLRSRLFTDAETPPLILTTNPDKRLAKGLEAAGAKVIQVPNEDYVAELRRLGYQRVVIEGGPGIYARAFRRSDVDLFHLTIDPTLKLGKSVPLLYDDQGSGGAVGLDLEHVTTDDEGCVFLRYRVRK